MLAKPPMLMARVRGAVAVKVKPEPGKMRMLMSPCVDRSEEHTSELQSLAYLVCRLLLEKKNTEILYLTAKGALTYTHIADDPAFSSTVPPRSISITDFFRSADSSHYFTIASGQLHPYEH